MTWFAVHGLQVVISALGIFVIATYFYGWWMHRLLMQMHDEHTARLDSLEFYRRELIRDPSMPPGPSLLGELAEHNTKQDALIETLSREAFGTSQSFYSLIILLVDKGIITAEEADKVIASMKHRFASEPTAPATSDTTAVPQPNHADLEARLAKLAAELEQRLKDLPKGDDAE